VRYPDGAGGLVSAPETFAALVDAERYLATVETDQSRGAWTDPRLGRQLFGDFAAEWWRTTVNLRQSTRARDEGYINRYVLPQFGSFMLAEITPLDVRHWVADLSSRGLAPATVVKAAQLLGKILAAAVDVRLIATSPYERVPLPRIERHEMRFLSPAEVASLSESIDPRYRALVLVGAFGGLRIGELAGLKRQRVDLLHRRLDVAEVCTEAEGHLYVGPPKTRAGRRSVPIPQQVVDELAEHLKRWAGPELVFTAPGGGPLRAASWRHRFWQPAVASAGLAPLRPHDLRHTAVALWIAEGANPKHIAALAGHTSVSFTLDRYGHLFPAADDELMARLDRAYTPVPSARDGARKGHDVISPLRRHGSE
jgi:integrase